MRGMSRENKNGKEKGKERKRKRRREEDRKEIGSRNLKKIQF